MANRPKPRELKEAAGTLRAGRDPVNVPQRIPGRPNPPKWMKGAVLEAWRLFSDLLGKRGQLSSDSLPSLVLLCATWVEWHELRADIAEHGRTQKVKTKAGTGEDGDAAFMERARPQVAMFQDADRWLKGLLIEFGLTDASRGKVNGSPPGEEDNPLAEFGLN